MPAKFIKFVTKFVKFVKKFINFVAKFVKLTREKNQMESNGVNWSPMEATGGHWRALNGTRGPHVLSSDPWSTVWCAAWLLPGYCLVAAWYITCWLPGPAWPPSGHWLRKARGPRLTKFVATMGRAPSLKDRTVWRR